MSLTTIKSNINSLTPEFHVDYGARHIRCLFVKETRNTGSMMVPDLGWLGMG